MSRKTSFLVPGYWLEREPCPRYCVGWVHDGIERNAEVDGELPV